MPKLMTLVTFNGCLVESLATFASTPASVVTSASTSTSISIGYSHFQSLLLAIAPVKLLFMHNQ
jgi:hypothetical protein